MSVSQNRSGIVVKRRNSGGPADCDMWHGCWFLLFCSAVDKLLEDVEMFQRAADADMQNPPQQIRGRS